jgi:hypothetical protein
LFANASAVEDDTARGFDTSAAETVSGSEVAVEIPIDSLIAEALRETAVDVPVDSASSTGTAVKPPPPDDIPERGRSKRLKFGRRVAYNNSSVAGLSVKVYSFDGEALSYTEYKTEAVHAIGFELNAILALGVTDAMALNFAPGVVFRKPLSTRFAGVGELALSFPMIMEWRPFEAVPLYALAGIRPDVPVYTRLTWRSEPSSEFREPYTMLGDRGAIDFGLVVGAGGYISDKASIDVRAIFGLARFDRVPGRRLNQFNLGINYVE